MSRDVKLYNTDRDGEVWCRDCAGDKGVRHASGCKVAEIERLRAALGDVLSCAAIVGMEWRMDWSDFDGRTLRDQMNDLGRVASGEITKARYLAMHTEAASTEGDEQ